MEDTRISLNTAKLAKEKGYPQKWNENAYSERKSYTHIFRHSGETRNYPFLEARIISFGAKSGFYENVLCDAPTQSLLQKWLREIHKIDIRIIGYGFGYYPELENVPPGNQENIKYKDRRWNLNNVDRNYNNLITYEEALEIGLQEALKLIEI